MQVFLIVLIFYQEMKVNTDLFLSFCPYTLMFYTRFICATLLHMILMPELSGALQRMKYAVNHPYKFENFAVAFFLGVGQFTAVWFTEVLNILIILTSFAPLGAVFNFIALTVIADFDNFIYEAMSAEYLTKLLEEEVVEEEFKIEHTTSKRCSYQELTEIEDDNGDKRPLRIRYNSRSCCNKFLFSFYKCFRLVYVSYYYYF